MSDSVEKVINFLLKSFHTKFVSPGKYFLKDKCLRSIRHCWTLRTHIFMNVF